MSMDAPLETVEHTEHAEHAAHAKSPFITLVSITIAVLAVVTAIVGSRDTVENEGAVVASNHAVLAQDQATDSWNFYQAKSLKKHLYTLAADAGGPNAAKYKETAASNGKDETDIQAEAKKHETERKEALEQAEQHEARSHRLVLSASLLQMAIAIATISIITGRRWPWLLSMGLGACGALGAISAYVLL